MCNIFGCTEVNPVLFTLDEYKKHLVLLEKLMETESTIWGLIDLSQRKTQTLVIIKNWRVE